MNADRQWWWRSFLHSRARLTYCCQPPHVTWMIPRALLQTRPLADDISAHDISFRRRYSQHWTHRHSNRRTDEMYSRRSVPSRASVRSIWKKINQAPSLSHRRSWNSVLCLGSGKNWFIRSLRVLDHGVMKMCGTTAMSFATFCYSREFSFCLLDTINNERWKYSSAEG